MNLIKSKFNERKRSNVNIAYRHYKSVMQLYFKPTLWITGFLLIGLVFTACQEIKTTDPNEAYKYWTGTNPPIDIHVLKGQYWESAHWTQEYILYLKLKPTQAWWNKYVQANHLIIDTSDWIKPSGKPDWFDLSQNCIRYRRDVDFDQGSRYFYDQTSGECYIYEIQL